MQCTLRIEAENYYSCDLTREIPVRVTIVAINGDTGFAIIQPLDGSEEDAVVQYIERLAKYDTIREVEITHRSMEGYWTRAVHHLDMASIYETVLESKCMISFPIVVERGAQDLVVLCPSREALSKLLKTLRFRFRSVQIRRLRSAPVAPSDVLLTPKQRDTLLRAYRAGYYEMPRRTTVTKLCDGLDVRRTAIQERLRRAEQRVIGAYVERNQ